MDYIGFASVAAVDSIEFRHTKMGEVGEIRVTIRSSTSRRSRLGELLPFLFSVFSYPS
jgi:hypothetical protein